MHSSYKIQLKEWIRVLSLGVPGVPWPLSQPGGAGYAHHITTRTPLFSDLATTLVDEDQNFILLQFIFGILWSEFCQWSRR